MHIEDHRNADLVSALLDGVQRFFKGFHRVEHGQAKLFHHIGAVG